MSKKRESREIKKWMMTSVILLAVPLIGGVAVATLNGAMQLTLAQNTANYFCWISLLTAMISVVAIFRLPNRRKLLPIVGFFGWSSYVCTFTSRFLDRWSKFLIRRQGGCLTQGWIYYE